MRVDGPSSEGFTIDWKQSLDGKQQESNNSSKGVVRMTIQGDQRQQLIIAMDACSEFRLEIN